jgi:RNA ligase (TIGR02306 family)
MKRKLASIQTITALTPIKKADRIELAKVLGWNVVVKKGEFQVGDLCVFFEIDSILPDVPWAEFLKDHSFKVVTRKFRGIYSQGLALPLDILGRTPTLDLNADMTELLGVTQQETAEDSYVEGAKTTPFPAGIPKSHATRLQSCPEVLDELRGKAFVITTKCDGKSATFLKRDGELIVASHAYAMEKCDNMFWEMAEKYALAGRVPEGHAVQGEICGPGIGRNRMRLDEKQLLVFDVFDGANNRYLDFWELVEFCDVGPLEMVPIVLRVEPTTYPDSVPDGHEISQHDGRLVTGHEGPFDPTLDWFMEQAVVAHPGNILAEGIVVKTLEETVSEALGMGRFQFKVHSPRYLLKGQK